MKLILSIILLAFPFFTDVGDDIVNALKYGDHKAIYKHLDEKVIVRILDKEDLLSKEQSSAYLSSFFDRNSIKAFQLVQNNYLSANTQFVYGIIDTGNNKYKLSILIKKSLIVQIRIDYFE